MTTNTAKKQLGKLLARADIRVNGDRPWDIRILDERFFEHVLAHGSLGLGESYMDRWWECDQVDELICKALRCDLASHVQHSWSTALPFLIASIVNKQRVSRAFNIGKAHYDMGNDLYAAMLDRRMVYSCGYWKNASNLDEAQEAKLDLVCKKLCLEPGMRLLDIGCGWGSLVKYAAENYGVTAVGITVSKQQYEYAIKSTAGLPITIQLQDYRSVTGTFDRIASVGMFEHVGYKNYHTFMNVASTRLEDDGLFLLHTLGSNQSVTAGDPWMNKYIFPDGMLPSVHQLGKALERFFIVEDWHNFGADYEPTLKAWLDNFNSAWPSLKENYDDRFYRMWTYYLMSCTGAIRARAMQVWQIVLSKKGVVGGYRSVR